MKLSVRAIIFLILLHILLFLLSLTLIRNHPLLFLAAEVGILLSIFISIFLFKQLINPLNLISSGIETMEEREFGIKLRKVGQPEWDKLIDVYNRMIESLRKERIKQQEQHYFLQKLIHSSPSGIIVLDFDEQVTMLNPAAERFLRVPGAEILGRKMVDLPGRLSTSLAALAPDQTVIHEQGAVSYKCTKASFFDRGFRHYFILIEELTEEIRKKEKGAYEKVIRMMSHEIGNSIGAINSILCSCLKYKCRLSEAERKEYQNALEVAIARNNHLNRFISNLADVVRLPQPVKETCDVHHLLATVGTLLQSDCHKTIDWRWELSDNPLLVKADIYQMEQVLLNILKNAEEAIPEKGTIIIRTHTGPAPLLSIEDTGQGLSTETLHYLFTPFYSTKKNGQGIGLTLTKEILLNHGFRFSLEQDRDGNTEFRIEF